jgi:methylmalonyl-CoA mutase
VGAAGFLCGSFMSDAKSDDLAALSAGFSTPGEAQWRAQVDKALKGGAFDRLISRTLDGIEIQPLYGRNTEGAPPLARAQAGDWRALTRIDHADPQLANEQAKADVAGGAGGLHLTFAGAAGAYGFGLPSNAAALREALAGIDLSGLALELDLADQDMALHVAALIQQQGIAPESAAVSFGLCALDNHFAPDAGFAACAKTLAAQGFKGSLAIADARIVHGAGGSDGQELAFALAQGIAALRALEDAGFTLEAARDAIAFRVAVDADFFASLCKLRALRRLWAQVESACGLAPKPVRIHTETAWRMMSRRDPWVNVLRATVAAFAAGAGGADSISVLPFTQAFGLPDAFARRLARNCQLVLAEEAHIGAVADPAAGAGGFEALTKALCEKAWSLFQEIERAGSLQLAQPMLLEAIGQARAARARDIARRKEPITGTSAFPDLSELQQSVLAPLPLAYRGAGAFEQMRLAEPFELLRDASDALLATKGQRPKVFLAVLGSPVAAAARIDFARGFFESGGFETIVSSDSFSACSASLACICGTDEAYAQGAEAAARELAQSGAKRVYLAGRGGDEAALRAAGVGEFIYMGVDVVAALQGAQAVSV